MYCQRRVDVRIGQPPCGPSVEDGSQNFVRRRAGGRTIVIRGGQCRGGLLRGQGDSARIVARER
jgi:hypothetical protein